jgi:hypothetical protein
MSIPWWRDGLRWPVDCKAPDDPVRCLQQCTLETIAMEHSQAVNAGAVLTYAAATVAIAGAAIVAVRTIVRKYRSTLGSRGVWVSLLNRLACGVTREYAENLLGVPAFRHAVERDGRSQIACDFRTPHAWVQIMYDEATDAVLQFSVTVTDQKFRFETSSVAWGHGSVLGVTRFSSLGLPSGVRLSVGARRFEYSEGYYYGNPGGYQHFVWSFNDAGVGSSAAFGELSQASVFSHSSGVFKGDNGMEAALPPAIEQFRSKVCPNTITVIGPMGSTSGLTQGDWIGVDKDRVRTLRTT